MTLRVKTFGYSLLRLAADALILAGIVAIVVFLWGFSEGEIYQYVQSVHLSAEVESAEPIPAISPESFNRIPQPRVRPSIIPTLAMMMDRDPLLLGRLEVQRLRFGVMIRDGVDDDTLRKAAGHVSGSPMPGEAGNVVIMAHRDTFFRPLRDIRTGDDIFVRTARNGFRYTVDSITVVEPESVHIESATEPVLTLITCFPFTYTGPAPRRFVVRARLTETHP